MPPSAQSVIETRRDQMFPILTAEIDRLLRFGERKSYAAGDSLVATGMITPGAFVILTGQVEVSQRGLGHSDPIVTHGPGSFLGELAQLSGRPALVDAMARERGRGDSSFRRAACAMCWWRKPSWASASCAP